MVELLVIIIGLLGAANAFLTVHFGRRNGTGLREMLGDEIRRQDDRIEKRVARQDKDGKTAAVPGTPGELADWAGKPLSLLKSSRIGGEKQ